MYCTNSTYGNWTKKKISDLTNMEHDPNFGKVYLQEKLDLLEVLQEGNSELFERCKNMLESYEKGEKSGQR